MAYRVQLKVTETCYMARRVYYIPSLGIKYNIKGKWKPWTPLPVFYQTPDIVRSGWEEVAAKFPVFQKQLQENQFDISYRK